MNDTQNSVIKRDLSLSMAQANLYTLIIILPPIGLLGLLFYLLWGEAAFWRGWFVLFGNVGIALLVIVGGIVVHELLHGVTWMLAGDKPRSAVKFGFQLKTLTPYAHCTAPLEVRAYRLGALMPGLLLGIVPLLAGMVTGSGALTIFGLFFTLAAGGDFLILWTLRSVQPGALVEDHPTRAGCYVLEPQPSE
ncbi:MAG: DUF3267 domain-containing protein [Chloroflexaceae bacterium]